MALASQLGRAFRNWKIEVAVGVASFPSAELAVSTPAETAKGPVEFGSRSGCELAVTVPVWPMEEVRYLAPVEEFASVRQLGMLAVCSREESAACPPSSASKPLSHWKFRKTSTICQYFAPWITTSPYEERYTGLPFLF